MEAEVVPPLPQFVVADCMTVVHLKQAEHRLVWNTSRELTDAAIGEGTQPSPVGAAQDSI